MHACVQVVGLRRGSDHGWNVRIGFVLWVWRRVAHPTRRVPRRVDQGQDVGRLRHGQEPDTAIRYTRPHARIDRRYATTDMQQPLLV
jgi:hypothetical protein